MALGHLDETSALDIVISRIADIQKLSPGTIKPESTLDDFGIDTSRAAFIAEGILDKAGVDAFDGIGKLLAGNTVKEIAQNLSQLARQFSHATRTLTAEVDRT